MLHEDTTWLTIIEVICGSGRPWNWDSTCSSKTGSPKKLKDQWVYGCLVKCSLACPDRCVTANRNIQ
jgi:hypothetical protein